MGAQDFITYTAKPNPDKAFKKAVKSAQRDHGRHGSTGTIAEKSDYVVLRSQPVPYDEAIEFAERVLREGDLPVTDKYGPAGAIAVRGGERQVEIDFDAGRELAPEQLPDYFKLLAAERFPHERLVAAEQSLYLRTNARGKVRFTLADGNTHTGWVFVGTASC